MIQFYNKPVFNGLELEDSRIEQVPNDASAYIDEGRFSFTADTKKLYIGDGTVANEVGASAILVDGLVDGTIIEKQGFTTQDNGVNIYAVVDKDGGGDIKVQFGETIYTVNATTVTDTEGLGNNKARVALTAGADASNPVYNYVYIIPNGGNPILQASSTLPTGEFAFVGVCLVPDLTTYQAEGVYVLQRYNNSIKHDGKGRIHYIDDKLRSLGATYKNGVAYATNEGASVGFSNTSGVVYQLHQQTFPTLDISVDGIYIANHPTTPFLKITDLADIEARQLADGTAIGNNDRFSYVIWGSINGDGESKLYVNLPSNTYSTNTAAYYDSSNYAVSSVPTDFAQTAFLIARIPFNFNNSGSVYEYINPAGTAEIIDLRGTIIGSTTGGGAGAPTNNAYIDFTTGLADPTQVEGRTFWSDENKALSYWTDVTGTAIQMGQELVFRCYNNSGALIPNGSVVYFDGTVTGGEPNVQLSQADVYNKCRSIGVATSDIPNTGFGFATKYGEVRNIDTSGFSAGDQVFLSPTTPGAFTNVRPSDPDYVVQVGSIITVNATTGVLFAIAQRGAIIRGDVTGLDFCECMYTTTRLSDSTYRVDGVDWTDRLGMVIRINTNDRTTNVITDVDTVSSPGNSIITVAGEAIPATLNFVRYNLANNKKLTLSANYWDRSFNSGSANVLDLDINQNNIYYDGAKGYILQIINTCRDVGTNTSGATFNATVNAGAEIATSDVSLVTGDADTGILINSANNEIVAGDEIRIKNDVASSFDDIEGGQIRVIIGLK